MLNFITWTANPNLYEGFVTVRWYGLMFAIGFLVGYEIVYRIFKHEGAPERWLAPLFFYVVIATILGARLGHVFFYEWDHYSQHPGDILKIWEGGLASHGGTIGIIIAIFIFSWAVTKKSVLWTLDRLCIPIGFVGALIRFGNLMNHEIYGGPTDLPWGFCFIRNINQYMQGAEPIFTQPCHPTQIYEALCYLLVFALCMWLYWRRNAQERPGLILGVFLIGIFASRFFIEFVKEVQVGWEESMRSTIGLDQGQMLSIPFIIAGIWLVVRALRRPREELEYPNEFSDAKEKTKK
ncbi:MAG: prolipoprotein diacylglyceryl transferase [Muribaculaceae bacterium]|nr:prolipoprotein diacylglyceryl transferase [Muribaculaceae bacterium]